MGVQGDVSNLADLDRLYETVKSRKAGSMSSSLMPVGAIRIVRNNY